MDDRESEVLWSRRAVVIAGAFFLAAAGLATRVEPSRAGQLLLFSENDAEQLRLSAEDWKRAADLKHGQRSALRGLLGAERGASAPAGPRIQVERPPVRTEAEGPVIFANSPTDLSVRFVENGSPIVMASLSITAHKGWFSKSLTDLLKPYLQGTTIDARQVEIPDGRFQIDIEIADARGGTTKESYFLVVK